MKVCLLTPGQPSTNPRLVKEADALLAAGYEVTVVYAHWADWASEMDGELLRARPWSAKRVGGDPKQQPIPYWYSRLRQGISRRMYSRTGERFVPRDWCLSRVTPELIGAAKKTRADLYIAHNLGALPAAIAGARKHGGRAAFDAEDLHSEMATADGKPVQDRLANEVEARWLPECDYVTTASPGLSAEYARLYGIAAPVPVLNVFPLEERPRQFRAGGNDGPLRLYWYSQTIGDGRGLEDAVQAIGFLGSGDVELYLQGEWSPGFEGRLRGVAEAAGLQSSQIVHLAQEPPAELVRRASTFDVGLALEQPTNKNRDLTVSNKMFTYILAGNAVIATSTAGQQAIVEQITPAGVSYSPGDVRTLAEAIGLWLGDRAALETARKASWDWGTRRFNWDVEKVRFLEVVRATISRDSRTLASVRGAH